MNKLDEPNHQALMRFIQDEVKRKGNDFQEPTEEIKSRSDVSEKYLSSKFFEIKIVSVSLTPFFFI